MNLTTYAKPLREKAVSEIDTEGVLEVLKPIWLTKPETAARVRSRIAAVLDFAKARGFRNGGENPARWRGHLDKVMATQPRGRHHPAMPYTDVTEFMGRPGRSRSGDGG
jgi:integrase